MNALEVNPVTHTSTYDRVFDETNWCWSSHPEYNLLFLKSTRNYMNDILLARGHMFLNDVYVALGFPRTPAGQLVGWLRDGNGDGYVSFGIYDNGVDATKPIILKFNVDGIMYDKI